MPQRRRERRPRFGRCLGDEIQVLYAEREGEAPWVVTGLDGGSPPLGLGRERRRGQHVEGRVLRQAESLRERKCLPERREDSEERGVGDEFRGGSRAEWPDVHRVAERREEWRPSLGKRLWTADEDSELPCLDLGQAAEDGRVEDARSLR